MLSLAELLAREADLVQAFVASLTTEQEALTHGRVDALAAIGGKKAELVEQLNAIEGQRNGLLRQAGHAGDRSGMQAWLSRNPGDRAAAREWARLTELATEAKQLNNLNGQLIALRLQATNQALAALTWQPQRPALYGPDGHSAQRTGSRIIDAA